MPLALFVVASQQFMPGEVAAVVTSWPVWIRVIASPVVGEFGFYWGHRLSHEIPLLWRFHVVHHNTEHIDWLVNTRAYPVDMVFTRLCGLAPLYILGLAAPVGCDATLIPLLVLLLGTVWEFFIHANVWWRFGPLERVVATPAFHHWHHANYGPAYINKNYSAMLPFIDQIFGTLYLPKNQVPRQYGTDQELPPDLVGQLIKPFKVWQPPALPASAIGRPARAPPLVTSGACLDVQVELGPRSLHSCNEGQPAVDNECPAARARV